MNYQKLHGKLIVCFSKTEIEQLYKDSQLPELKQQMEQQGVTVDDLEKDLQNQDTSRFKKLADEAGKKTAHDRDLHEIFAAWNISLPFYEEGSKVCFELKNSFVHSKNIISSVDDLNRFREDVFGDFIIKSSDGFGVIQLKRYRGSLDAQEICQFLKTKLAEYGKGIGDTNLLVILQSSDSDLDQVDFDELHQCLKKADLSIKSQVLIAFNANNKKSVIVQVYPEHAVANIPINWASGHAPDSAQS